MQFFSIYRVTPGTRPEQVAPLVKDESAHNWELYAAGVFRQSFYFADLSGALVLLEASDLAEATAAAKGFPMVKAGLLTTEVIALQPYLGTAQLFAKEA